MKAITILFAIFGLILASSALAEELHAGATFEMVDKNSDGYIDTDEAKARKDLGDNWQNIDKDSDGKIDVSEFSAFESIDRFVPPEDMEVSEPGAAPH